MKATWIVALASMAAVTAFAQDQGSSSYRTFGQLDTNSDGRVTTPEASSYSRFNDAFNASDKNGDGWISESEYDAWMRDSNDQTSTAPSGQSSGSESSTQPGSQSDDTMSEQTTSPPTR